MLALLYTNNEFSKRENKVPMEKVNQGGNGPALENYKVLKKEIEEDVNKWEQREHTST